MDQESYCTECWCKLPAGVVAWRRLDGKLVCAKCFQAPATTTDERKGAYSDGR
jgi:hypothetical protein